MRRSPGFSAIVAQRWWAVAGLPAMLDRLGRSGCSWTGSRRRRIGGESGLESRWNCIIEIEVRVRRASNRRLLGDSDGERQGSVRDQSSVMFALPIGIASAACRPLCSHGGAAGIRRQHHLGQAAARWSCRTRRASALGCTVDDMMGEEGRRRGREEGGGRGRGEGREGVGRGREGGGGGGGWGGRGLWT